MIPKIETASSNLPEICFKCGSRKLLQSRNHEFRFRPFFGWVGIFVGVTYEFVWEAKIFLCRGCSDTIDRMRKIAYVPLIASFLLAALSLYLTFLYLEIGLFVLAAGLVSVIAGIILFARFSIVANPKAKKISRRELQVEIPTYGVFDYQRIR